MLMAADWRLCLSVFAGEHDWVYLYVNKAVYGNARYQHALTHKSKKTVFYLVSLFLKSHNL